MKVTDITHNISTISALPAEQTEEKSKLLKLDLQFFADDSDDADDDKGDDADDEGDDEEEDEGPDFDELLKDPKYKAAHEAKLQKQIDRRLKKYKDVDVAEYKRLKAAADKAAGNKQQKEDSDDDANKEADQKLAKVEKREKKAAIKLFAAEAEVDSFLLEKFVNFEDIELNEDGEAENLEELLDELRDDPKTARYFAAQDDEDEDDEPKKKKSTSFTPGRSKQKTNKTKKLTPAEIGKQKALERHAKKQ